VSGTAAALQCAMTYGLPAHCGMLYMQCLLTALDPDAVRRVLLALYVGIAWAAVLGHLGGGVARVCGGTGG
jgi:hypothetical protein